MPTRTARDLRDQLKAEGLVAARVVAEMEEHLAAEAQRGSIHTVDTPPAPVPGRWAVDAGGLAERVGHQADAARTAAALNGRAAGGPGDGAH